MHPSRVFISYAKEDIAAARAMFSALRGVGLRPWLDCECMFPGQHWDTEIRRALKESDFVLVLLSSRQVLKRGYVQREIREALDMLKEMPDNRIFIIPARLDDCQPGLPGLLELQWVDLFPDWQAGFQRIHAVFERVPDVTPVPTDHASLTGTYWVGDQKPGGQWRFAFMPNGVLRYEDAAIDRYLENATWTQSEDTVYIQLNSSYVQISGSVLDDRHLRGRGESIGGWRFELEAIRVESPFTWRAEK